MRHNQRSCAPMTVYSAGWGMDVAIGSGQAHALGIMREVAAGNPGRRWHDLPPLRELGRSPSTAHRVVHRLAALGIVAIQARRGCKGGIRFTFRVRRWKWGNPVRHALTLARMTARRVVGAIRAALVPAQLALAHTGEPPPPPPPLTLVPGRLGIAPVFEGACHVCGAWARVAEGVWRDERGRYEAGHRCIDHEACERRRGR